MSEKLFVFQTDEKGKVTNVKEILKTGQYVDKTVYMDVLNSDDLKLSFTITPIVEGGIAPSSTNIYLRAGDSAPGAVMDVGISPGHNQPAPTPGPGPITEKE